MDLLSKKYEQAKEIAELKAENDKLKEEIKEYKKHSKCAWKCFENTLCEEGEKYKTCLRRIKKIAEKAIKTTGTISAGFIVQTITEAEEEWNI